MKRTGGRPTCSRKRLITEYIVGFLVLCQEANVIPRGEVPKASHPCPLGQTASCRGQHEHVEADRSVRSLESYGNKHTTVGNLHHSLYKTGRVVPTSGGVSRQMCKVPCTVTTMWPPPNRCLFPSISHFLFHLCHA